MTQWVLSPLARQDLQEILDYIAADSGSLATADKVAGDFEAALGILVASPGIGWRRDPLTGPGIRWWRVHSYLLVYDPGSKPLRVIRVLHGARDLERLFR
jgi:plasmid stabilization system protein ParE